MAKVYKMPDGPIQLTAQTKKAVMVAIAIAVALALLAGIKSGFYTIGPEEVGVVTRFGKFYKIAQPGLNFKLPLGIDIVEPVPVRRQEKEEFGFRTKNAGKQTSYDKRSFEHESLMVTGDLNAAEVEWSVQYLIKNAEYYQFNVSDPKETLRDASESVMRKVVGDRTVDEVLTVGRQELATEAQVQLQTLMDEYELGIKIVELVLGNVTPPDEVKASFNEVNQAQQEREKLINEAKAEYNSVVPKASGEADQKIQAAEGYAIERVNNAEGDRARFTAVLEEYRKSPEITRRRIYLETMGEILPKLGRKYIIDENSRGVLPLMQLDAGEGRK